MSSESPLQSTKESLYRNADFMKLWVGQSFSLFGSLISRIAFPLFIVFSLRATPTQVAWVRVAEIVPGILVGLMVGSWIDRVLRRRMLIWVDLLRMLCIGSIPLVSFAAHVRLLQVVLVAACLSALNIVFDSVYEAYLPFIVYRDHVVEANSRLAATSAIAEFAGFGIAGALFNWVGGALTLSVDALTFALSIAGLSFIRKREPAHAEPAVRAAEDSPWREALGGWRLIMRDRNLGGLMAASGLQNMFYGCSGTVFILFVSRALHISPALQGLLYAVGGLASFGMANMAARIFARFRFGRSLVSVSLIGTLGAAILPCAVGGEGLLIGFVIAQQLIGDGADTILEIGLSGYRQVNTDTAILGRVNAAWNVGVSVCTLLGTLLGGMLGDAIGLRLTLIAAVLIRIGAAICLRCTQVWHIERIDMGN